MINTAAKLTSKDIERIRMETTDECYKEYQDLNMPVWNFFNNMKDWKAGKTVKFEDAEKFRDDCNKFIGKIQDILNAVEWTVMKQKLSLSDIEQWYREFQENNKKKQIMDNIMKKNAVFYVKTFLLKKVLSFRTATGFTIIEKIFKDRIYKTE